MHHSDTDLRFAFRVHLSSNKLSAIVSVSTTRRCISQYLRSITLQYILYRRCSPAVISDHCHYLRVRGPASAYNRRPAPCRVRYTEGTIPRACHYLRATQDYSHLIQGARKHAAYSSHYLESFVTISMNTCWHFTAKTIENFDYLHHTFIGHHQPVWPYCLLVTLFAPKYSASSIALRMCLFAACSLANSCK